MTIPAFLMDYNSIQNPILMAFVRKVTMKTDKNQVTPNAVKVGLSRQENRKMIDPTVLKKYGGKEISFRKDDVIFREADEALNYFQIIKGSIKVITESPDGKEFIQGIFKANDSFGEPPLICSFAYPSTAIALELSTVIKLAKDRFLTLLKENFEIHLHLDRVLCERLKYKSMVLSEISSYDPEHRIVSILKYLKSESNRMSKAVASEGRMNREFIVPFTRQQLADMSGLRVETVIRTVKKMEDEGKLRVVSRKIAF